MLSLLGALSFSSALAAYEVPSIPLSNAAKDGVSMPLTGLGTGGYGHNSTDPSACESQAISSSLLSIIWSLFLSSCLTLASSLVLSLSLLCRPRVLV